MFKQNTYIFLYLFFLGMTCFVQGSGWIEDDFKKMRMIVSNCEKIAEEEQNFQYNSNQIKDCVFYQYHPHGHNSFEVHWYKYIEFRNEISLIKGEVVTVPDNQTIEDYCNAILDQCASLILPDHVEIIQKSKANSLIANFYRDNKLIASNISLGTYNSSTIDKLLHVKANDHFLTQYYRPSNLLSKVKKVTYNNGFYNERTLFYKHQIHHEQDLNTTKISLVVSDEILKICITWQEELKQQVKGGFVLILLFLAIKIRFQAIKTVSPYYYFRS